MSYTYKLIIKPWYPSFVLLRAPMGTEEWETVMDMFSSPYGVKRRIIFEIEKLFETPPTEEPETQLKDKP